MSYDDGSNLYDDGTAGQDVPPAVPPPAAAAVAVPSKSSHKRGLSWIIVGVLALAIIGVIVFVFVKIFILDKGKDKTLTVKAKSSLSATSADVFDPTAIPSDWPDDGKFTVTGTVTYTSKTDLSATDLTLTGDYKDAWTTEIDSTNKKTVTIKGSGKTASYTKRPTISLKLAKELAIQANSNASFVLTLSK